MSLTLRLALVGSLAACARSPLSAPAPADLIVRGPILTGTDVRRVDAIAIRGGAVAALGDEALALAGPSTRELVIAGSCTPGLVDAHAHPAGLGRSLEIVDLRGAASVDAVVARTTAGAPPEGWVIGRGWDQNLWSDTAMPSHHALSAAFPDRPVWLRRVDGHAGWANQALLELAGIGPDTVSPEGGEILRDAEGRATGVLVDGAMGLIDTPDAEDGAVLRWLLGAQEHLLARGITGVHDMGVGGRTDQVYRELAEAGQLKLRITGYAHEGWFTRDLAGTRAAESTSADRRYALVGVKVYADGALGSRGAALAEDYSDRAGHRGLLSRPAEEFQPLFRAGTEHRWQLATHAIGDAAIHTVLEGYRDALAASPWPDARLRVEHTQIVDVDDIPAFAELGVVASMQPTHATSDMPWVPARIGDSRLDGAYAWRRLLDADVHLAFGSDFPVERADITYGLHAAIARQDEDGQPAGGWLPDQRLSLDEAIAGFSAGSAWAAHSEAFLGTLAPGMAADLSCFGVDLDAIEPAAVRDAPAVATIIAGEVVWQAPG